MIGVVNLPKIKKMTRKTQIGYGKILTADEISRLLGYLYGEIGSALTGDLFDNQAPAGRRTTLIVQILLNTGLRIGELARLRVKDTPVVVGENVIEVYRGKYDRDRSIPISQTLAKAIAEYYIIVRPRTLPRWAGDGDFVRPLFYSDRLRPYLQKVNVKVRCPKCRGEGCKRCGDQGKVMVQRQRASTTLYRMITGIGKHAGLAKGLHPHMLRHTFAVLALGRDNIYQVMQWMGHSDMKVTARYLHLVDWDIKAQGERLNFSFDSRFL